MGDSFGEGDPPAIIGRRGAFKSYGADGVKNPVDSTWEHYNHSAFLPFS
jgi:hypothetical protein